MRQGPPYWDTCSEAEALHCKDRVYASIMGAKAVDVLLEGKTKRVIGYKNGEYVDFDINEALAMKKTIPDYQFEISYSLSHNYSKNV